MVKQSCCILQGVVKKAVQLINFELNPVLIRRFNK